MLTTVPISWSENIHFWRNSAKGLCSLVLKAQCLLIIKEQQFYLSWSQFMLWFCVYNPVLNSFFFNSCGGVKQVLLFCKATIWFLDSTPVWISTPEQNVPNQCPLTGSEWHQASAKPHSTSRWQNLNLCFGAEAELWSCISITAITWIEDSFKERHLSKSVLRPEANYNIFNKICWPQNFL